MGKYLKHGIKWKNCTKCCLCKGRTKVVLARGKIPCDILFVGEAPGVSEDVIGKPFIGPAGKLLDTMIEQAFTNLDTYCLTNLIGCIPKDENNSKVTEPPKESIQACSPRLVEMYRMCNPSIIICVGALAKKWVPKILKMEGPVKYYDIIHPAALLRMPTERRDYAIQQTIIKLQDIADELIPF